MGDCAVWQAGSKMTRSGARSNVDFFTPANNHTSAFRSRFFRARCAKTPQGQGAAAMDGLWQREMCFDVRSEGRDERPARPLPLQTDARAARPYLSRKNSKRARIRAGHRRRGSAHGGLAAAATMSFRGAAAVSPPSHPVLRPRGRVGPPGRPRTFFGIRPGRSIRNAVKMAPRP